LASEDIEDAIPEAGGWDNIDTRMMRNLHLETGWDEIRRADRESGDGALDRRVREERSGQEGGERLVRTVLVQTDSEDLRCSSGQPRARALSRPSGTAWRALASRPPKVGCGPRRGRAASPAAYYQTPGSREPPPKHMSLLELRLLKER